MPQRRAFATIPFEVKRIVRKGLVGVFNFSNDVLGEAHIFERAFGISPRALSEAVTMLENHIQGGNTNLNKYEPI